MIFMVRIDVTSGENSYGSVHYTILANGGTYPVHVCEIYTTQF